MVSSSLDKKEDAAPRRKNVNKSTQSVSRSKPLIKYRFYLDVKNRVSANKLEVKIKELGGELELFLTKELTHVITDREECYSIKGGGFNPKTPQSVTNVSCHNDSGNILENTPTRGRPKTRADAMLERARKTPTIISKDLLEQARNWGITIWTIDKAFTWLDKVTLSLKVSIKKKNLKVFELKPPYIKFEAFDRHSRPVFQEIRNWPILNIFGSIGDPGIVSRSLVERNMTRKTRSNHPRIDTALQPGYCEVCRVEYPRLNDHLESEKHLSFVKDNSNFLQLDTLINSTANIDSFLKINGVHSIDQLNSTGRRKMPRTRTISLSEKVKNSPLSPTGSESGHRLRSRRQCSINSYLSPIAHEDGQPIKFEEAGESRELRSSTRQLLKLVENEQKDTWDSGRPKRTCIKQKRSSAEERLVLDNQMFYKVEVLSGKLRSSTDRIKEEPIKRVQTPAPQEHKENNKDKSLIVKFKRMRSSELKQLNNEAENFLFPKKDESSSEDDLDADGPDTTASTRDGDSTLILSSEADEPKGEEVKHLDEASLDSNWSESSVKKKKRRTHAEAFILDNQKYYKFETPGSRLRYHGSYLHPVTNGQKSPKHNGEYSGKNAKSQEKEPCKTEKKEAKPVKLNLKGLQFSFERVPQTEPWYQTFRRQDMGEEYYTCFSDSGYWKPLLLPYQMGLIPPLDPRLCIKAYQEVKKHFLEPSSATTSAGTNTPDLNCEDENSIDLQEESSKASEDSNMTANTKTDDESKLIETDPAKQKKRKGVVISKNPRKSPRQHASTLAILSSLIHQRKRRSDFNRSRSSDLNASKHSLPSIPEQDEGKRSTVKEEPNYERIAKSMDEVLHSMDDLYHSEISSEENLGIDIRRKLSAVDILEDYDRRQKEGGGNLMKRIYASGKKPGRKKKKKNRTGWPNKNRRTKKGTETTVKEEPDDNSTVDSLSVNADSDSNENCDEATEDVSGDVHSIMEKNNCANHITNKIDQSHNVQLNVNKSANVQTSRVTVTDKLRKQDRVNTMCVNDNCTDKLCNENSNDRIVDLDRWENAEKVLSAKVTNNEINNDIQFQPYVRVQKLDSSNVSVKHSKRHLRNSSSPHRTVKRPRRIPASPKSPRMLRRPRGRWYRER